MNGNIKVTAFLFFLSIYYFIASFSFSNLVNDSEFYGILNFIRILLALVLILSVSLWYGLKKSSLIFFLFVALFIFLFDPFFTSIAFLLLISLILFNYCSNFNIKTNNEIIKNLNYISISSFLLIVFLNNFGVISNNVYDHSAEYVVTVRQSLGFTNPNQGALFILQTFFVAYLIKDRLGMFLSIIIFLIASLFFVSKTAIVSLLFFVLCSIIFTSEKIIKLIKICLLLLLLLYPVIVIIFISVGNWSFGGVNFDILLTTRLSGIKLLYETYGGIGLFPKTGDFFVDSGLSNLLIKGGFFIYFLFVLFVSLFVFKEKDERVLLVFLVYICYCFSENIFNGNLLLPTILLAKFFQNRISR